MSLSSVKVGTISFVGLHFGAGGSKLHKIAHQVYFKYNNAPIRASSQQAKTHFFSFIKSWKENESTPFWGALGVEIVLLIDF